MDKFVDLSVSAFGQLAVILFISLFVWGNHYLFSKNRKSFPYFIDYVGLRRDGNQFDRNYFLILIAAILFSAGLTVLQFQFSETFRSFLIGDTSPYGKILKNGFGILPLALGIMYCFVQAAAAEELLFRGLIAKRLFNTVGNLRGNIIQALIFWLMHLAIFRLILGVWFSWIQLFAFAMSFGLGLVLGYVNFRRKGQSLWPSWLLHGSVNLAAFLTLAMMINLSSAVTV